MKIQISDLESVAEILFKHLKERGVDCVDIDFNLFWTIGVNDRFELNKKPDEILVGSLEDDGGDLLRILNGRQPALASHFQQLASILDVVGFVLAEKLASEGG
jgi:hypothetical protein